ncbi:hypothetical protein HQ602_19215 [Rhodococcus kroppenstedtii]|nr:hypothetical protein [Rhodococcus kroppenstedtii]
MYGIKTTAAVLAFSSGAQLSGLRVAGTTTDSTTEKTTPACTKEFQQGAIYVAFQNASGSAIANGPLRDKYNSVGGLTPGSSFLGYLTGDHVRALPDGQGQMARFQNGVIYYPPTTGAHPVSGPLLDMWAAEGYEQGAHKYPTADQVNLEAPRIEQQFQIGKLEWPAFTDVAENNITTYETTKTSLLSEAMVSRARIQIYDGTDPSVSARALPTTGQPTECTTGRKNDSRTRCANDSGG